MSSPESPAVASAPGASGRAVSRFALWVLLVAVTALGFWTWLVAGTTTLVPFDTASRPPRIGDTLLEICRAISVLTMPLALVGASGLLAWWAHVRRLRNLAFALVTAALLAWSSSAVLRMLAARPRPDRWYDPTFTEQRLSYPSAHVAVAMTLAIMVVTIGTVTRRPRRDVRRWRSLAVIAVAVVAVARWLSGAHWASDIVGGLLLGVASAAAGAAASGLVRQPAWYTSSRQAGASVRAGRCAVVYNPAKIADEATFRRRVTHELQHRGWEQPLWFATTEADPGYSMARQAIAARVDRVLVAGGDGTVRILCSELAHTAIALGIIPAGTANLLCRNLGIPLDESEALDVALDGRPHPLDLVLVAVNGDRRRAEHFAVMGGLGIDGKVMADTNAALKKAVKSVAYFVAVAQNINTAPVPATITLDGKLIGDNPATLMLVGNVGEIQAGLKMFPDATPYDGELDLLVTGPTGFGQWFRWGLGVLRRRHTTQVLQAQGRTVQISVAEPMPYQFDGDTMGMAQTFEAEVVPGAVTVMVPRR